LHYQVRNDAAQDWQDRSQVIRPFQPGYLQPMELPVTLDGEVIIIDDSALDEYNPAWLSADFQETAEPTSESTCAGNPNLPAGIDGRVCTENVANAQQLGSGYDSYHLMSPSGNIACRISVATPSHILDCVMEEPA